MELGGSSNTNANSEAEIQNDGILHPVVASINGILHKAVSSCSSDGMILCRVPEPLRSTKPEAYTPTLVTIGPFHSGRDDLVVNSFKTTLFHNFLHFTKLTTDVIIEEVEPLEQKARCCYTESINMDRNKFLELLVLDGCFVVMHLIGSRFPDFEASNTSNLWKFKNEISCDLILLENQLPFFLLESLYRLFARSQPLLQGLSFVEIFGGYLIDSNHQELYSIKENVGAVNHFVGLLTMPSISTSSDETSINGTFWPPTATELNECGVTFRMEKHVEFIHQKSLLWLLNRAYLELPQIIIFDDFEKRVRNLIAYEQCQIGSVITNEVTNFAVFMKYLVQTDQDVKLLIRAGIIQNNLGSIKEVTQLFNNLGKYVYSGTNSYNSSCKRMREYCKHRHHVWWSSLRRNYFSSPWAIASSLSAILLLVLTFTQVAIAIASFLKQLEVF